MRAGDFAEIGAADDEIDFLGGRLALRQADAGNLGNGVDAARHQTRQRGRRQAQCNQRGAPALIGGGAGQRRRSDGIAGGKYPGDIGFKALVHLHRAARAYSQSKAVKTNAVEIGDAAEGREHDVRCQCCAAAQLHFDLRESVEACAADLGAAAVLAAHGAKRREKSAAQRRVEKPQGLRGLVQHRHRATQRGEDRGIFASDDAAAQHQHGAGNVGQAQNGIAVDDVLVIHFDGRHMTRPRSGGEHHARRLQNAARTVQMLHFDAMRVQEDAFAANQIDAIALKLRQQIFVLRGNDHIDAVQQSRQRRIAAQLDRQGALHCLACADSAMPVRAAPCSEWCPKADRNRPPAARAR